MTIATWYWLAFPAWLVVAVTAAARLSDIGRANWAWMDHGMRLGLVLAGAGAILMLTTPWATDGWRYPGATWRGVVLAWGWALVWVMKRDAMPWYDWIEGAHRRTADWSTLTWRQKLKRELRALRLSFTPRRFRSSLAGPVGRLP